MFHKIEDWLRDSFGEGLHLFEVIIYLTVGVLMVVSAGGGVIHAAVVLVAGLTGSQPDYALKVFDELLLVLMWVEILHTVRISIKSQTMVMEPFLIVGLIASIRRLLVITMQAAQLVDKPGTDTAFRNSMIELGLSGALILVFVFSIVMIRRRQSTEDPPEHPAH